MMFLRGGVVAIEIGVAPGTWGIRAANAPGQTPWHTYLDEAGEAGYAWTEAGPYGYLPTDPAVLRPELERRGLGITATTVMKGHLDVVSDWPVVEAETLRAGELGAAMGARQLVLIDDFFAVPPRGRPPRDSDLDPDRWSVLIDSTNRVADLVLERFGLPIAFHAHAETHVETEPQLERFLADTDPERVSLCFDTGHHTFAGGDVASFLAAHHDRVSYLHFKNVDAAVLPRASAGGLSLESATEMGVWCDLDAGAVDYGEIAGILRSVGYEGWVMVELDARNPPAGQSLDRAKRAREHLEGVGFSPSER